MIIKSYFLTQHAKERMKERGISEIEIESAISDPEIIHPGIRGDINVTKTINNRKIKVSYIIERNMKKIITAMILSKKGK